MAKYSKREEEFGVLSEKPIDILGAFLKYLSYWKWFLLSLFICVALAVVYLSLKLPTYSVKTAILFKDDRRGSEGTDIQMFKELGLVSQKNNVDNEIELLQKSLIVEQVIRKLEIYATYTELNSPSIVRIGGLNKILPLFEKHKVRVLYGDESPVLVQLPDDVLNKLQGSIAFEVLAKKDGTYEFSGKYGSNAYHVNANVSDKSVILPFGRLILRNVNNKPTEDMRVGVVLRNPANVADEYLSQLKIELVSKTSSVADVSLKCANANLGKDFIREFIDSYNTEIRKDQIELAEKTSKIIDEHLAKLSDDLSAVESRVEDYKQSQGLTDIAMQSTLYSSQTAEVEQRRRDVEAQLSIVSSLNSYVQKNNNHNQLIPSNSGVNSVSLNQMMGDYNNLVLERNKLSRIASGSNQAMVDLTSRIETMYSTVKSSLQNEENNLRTQQQELWSNYAQNSARVRAIPRQERVYSDIRRQQNVKEGLFLFLLQKKEEKYINMATVEPNSKIVDNIRLAGQVAPNKMMTLLIALMLGLLIPFAVIYIKSLLRYQIENKEELQNLSAIPVLGEIPRITQKGSPFIVKENNTDSFTEMMRLLRTNLLFIIDSKDKKVINMLSSISGDGKTFLTINLATSLAFLDKKVIILDLDIRKSKLAEYIGLDKDKGVTLYLSGHASMDEIIKPSGIHPNLSVITAGAIPPNPNELLARPSLDELVAELRKSYDFIIIDTAPLGMVSDSLVLNRLADTNLYVVRAEHTPKKYIEDLSDLVGLNKLNNVYFVLNSVNLNSSKYGYRYPYGNKYKYGYGVAPA